MQYLNLLKRHHVTSIIVLILSKSAIIVDLSIDVMARVQIKLILKNWWLVGTSQADGLEFDSSRLLNCF